MSLPLTGLTNVRELAALALELDEPGRQAWLDAEPRLIGPYRLLRALGSGGMGTVWLAERADGAYRRRVALKLPRHELAPGLLARWKRERDILARLEHPNIARLYDAGEDASGQPYLVLEFVDGQPIDRHAERLDLRTRLSLFLKVIEAVSHAHRLGILHRDIKPGNILVDPHGHVRLLDFGIAKILAGEEEDPMTQLTEIGGLALSPDYASPEHVCGEPLSVTSDVYSLGAVLHSLLVGAPPHCFEGRHTVAVATALRGEDPIPVSHRASTPALRRLLAGDLDAILAQALRNRPTDRYPTADALGADISRYLDGLPVLARRHGRLYGARKFMHRHRTVFTVSLLLILGSAVLGSRLGAFKQHGASPAAADAAVGARIVVLPFTNLTGQASQDYLAESFTTSLTADLARIRDVQVIDVETARSMRWLADQPGRLSAALGVGYALTGSIRSSDDHLQVRAELRDTHSGATLWTQDYQGDQANLFELQDRMTSRVGETIGHQLLWQPAASSAGSLHADRKGPRGP